MKKNKNLIYFLLFAIVMAMSFDASSQCAMCKAAAESSLKNGGSIEKGINSGIIYLMGVPYMLLATFCIIFRRDISAAYHRWRGTSPDALNSAFRQYRFLFVFFAALSVIFLTFAYVQLSR
jgi:hypothetical protein